MTRLAATLALSLAGPGLAAAPAAAPRPAADGAFAIGAVIPSKDDVTIDGWRRAWGTVFVRRVQNGDTATETTHCCVSVFTRGKAYLVLKTEPVTMDSAGHPLTERIERKLWVTQRSNEDLGDCLVLWIEAALSFADGKTDMVRSVIVEGDELVLLEWKGASHYCAFGD